MRLQTASIAGQCDIDKVLIVAQILKGRRDAALVVVPTETKVLCICHLMRGVACNDQLERLFRLWSGREDNKQFI